MAEPLPVDFHVHLDLYPDMEKAYAFCASRNAITLAVTTTSRAFQRNLDFAEGIPNINVALGLHPQLIESGKAELRQFEKLTEKTRFIGEIGLDAGRDHYSMFEDQERVFERILRLCHEHRGKVNRPGIAGGYLV